MEGDAGTSRLNPTDAHDPSLSEVKAEDSGESEVGTDQAGSEVKAEDSGGSEVGPDQASSVVKAEDSGESEVGTEDGDSPTRPPVVERGPSRLGRGWFIGITAALLVLAGGVGAGGYFAMRT